MESSTTKLLTAIVITLLQVGCYRGEPENRYTGGDFNPVYPDMLVGCQYTGRTGGSKYDDLKWTFDETSFEIIAGANGMPSDLAEALLPPGSTAERITGTWRVEGEVLTLSELSADGTPLDLQPVKIKAVCTPVIRIQPQSAQYMFRSR